MPGGARFLRVQVPNPPGSGKDIVEGKSVHREMESEGSRMWGTYDYYVNFQKVYENAGRFKVELNLMNSLIGSKNIQQDFKNLTIQYPSVLHCVPTLLAVRQAEIYAQDDSGAHIYNFLKQTNSLDEYIVFMEKTGLFDLIANHLINNLYDYAIGVEVGLACFLSRFSRIV